MRKTAKNTTYHAYRKDIGRNISHGKKRFFSILVITILGVMMFSGLQASCQDLRISADQFFDAQKLHDLMVRSTLGLTDEDVEELSGVGGIAAAEGIYSEEADVFLLNGSSTGKYEELVRGVRQDIENTVKAGAEKRRTETVKADAQAEYDRQEQSAQDKLDEAKKKLDDGQAELDSSIRE